MAKKEVVTPAPDAAASEEGKGQGRAVVLPNGQKRIDFIRDEYYKKGTKRGDIRKAVNAMYPDGSDGSIPYQIVFAATKTGAIGDAASDPRLIVKAPAEVAAK